MVGCSLLVFDSSLVLSVGGCFLCVAGFRVWVLLRFWVLDFCGWLCCYDLSEFVLRCGFLVVVLGLPFVVLL